MDLRGSSSSKASGSRVSAIPPAPMCCPMAVDRVTWAEGAKAAAEPTRAAITASLYCNDKTTWKNTKVSEMTTEWKNQRQQDLLLHMLCTGCNDIEMESMLRGILTSSSPTNSIGSINCGGQLSSARF